MSRHRNMEDDDDVDEFLYGAPENTKGVEQQNDSTMKGTLSTFFTTDLVLIETFEQSRMQQKTMIFINYIEEAQPTSKSCNNRSVFVLLNNFSSFRTQEVGTRYTVAATFFYMKSC